MIVYDVSCGNIPVPVHDSDHLCCCNCWYDFRSGGKELQADKKSSRICVCKSVSGGAGAVFYSLLL